MAKLELKGTIESVSPVEVFTKEGKKDLRKQQVILNVAGYTDSYGIKVGRDESWCLEVLNDNIEKFGLDHTFAGMRADCSLFLNSSKVEGEPLKKNGEKRTFYIINPVLAKIEFKS